MSASMIDARPGTRPRNGTGREPVAGSTGNTEMTNAPSQERPEQMSVTVTGGRVAEMPAGAIASAGNVGQMPIGQMPSSRVNAAGSTGASEVRPRFPAEQERQPFTLSGTWRLTLSVQQ
jgi:hypothetical protein